MGVVREELLDIKRRFADPRRTEILPGVEGDFSPGGTGGR